MRPYFVTVDTEPNGIKESGTNHDQYGLYPVGSEWSSFTLDHKFIGKPRDLALI